MYPTQPYIDNSTPLSYQLQESEAFNYDSRALSEASPANLEDLKIKEVPKKYIKNDVPVPTQTIHHTHYQKKLKKPKRNRSAFIIYSAEKRAEMNSQVDNDHKLNSNNMMVKLAEMWGSLSKEEKKQYYAKAAKDKLRYLRELGNFQKQHPEEDIKNRTKKNHIKKPCSSYALFVKEMKVVIKRDNPELKMADVLKIAAEKWKEISDLERSWYQQKAKEEKESFNLKMEMNSMPSGSDEMEVKCEDCMSEMVDGICELPCNKMLKGEINAVKIYGEVMRVKDRQMSGKSMFESTKCESRGEMNVNFTECEGEIELPELDWKDLDMKLLKDRDATEIEDKENMENNIFNFEETVNILDLSLENAKKNSEVVLDMLNYENSDFSKENYTFGFCFVDLKGGRGEKLSNIVKNVMKMSENEEYFEEQEEPAFNEQI